MTQQINVWKWVITCKNELLPVNRQKILQKLKERYSKEKAAEYYWENKEPIKEKSKNTKTCQKKKKTRLKSTEEKDISNWFSTKREHYKINEFCFCSV